MNILRLVREWVTSVGDTVAGITAVAGAAYALIRWFQARRRRPPPSEIPEVVLSPRDRSGLIERVWAQRIVNGLEQSLRHAVEIRLDLREVPELVKLSYQQTTGGAGERVEVLTAYQEAGRQLAILGGPGSGKTTQALILMRHLLEVARQDPEASVPEVFPLASWAKERKPLLEWLTDQLQLRHGYRPSAGRSLIFHHQVIPVLDGLDEVDPDARASCVAAINTFWKNHQGGPLILCSRLAEYEALPERVMLGGAVTVDPPSEEEIDRYLDAAGPAWEPVRQRLGGREAPALRELLSTPLMLSAAVLAYEDGDPTELWATEDTATQARQLWARYFTQMREQSYDPLHPMRRDADILYTERQVTHWLGWLASEMRARNETELWLHEWVGSSGFRRRVQRAVALFVGLVVGQAIGLIYGLDVGLVAGLGFGLGFGLVLELIGRLAREVTRALFLGFVLALFLGLVFVNPAGELSKALLSWLTFGLFLGFLYELIGGLAGDDWRPSYRAPFSRYRLLRGLVVGLVAWLVVGIVVGIVVGLISGLISGLTFGLVGALVAFGPDKARTPPRSPNQIVSNSGYIGLAAGLVFGLAFGLSRGLDQGLALGLPFGLAIGLVFGLRYGLNAVAIHYAYRLRLRRSDHAPLRWVQFLDWSCSHLYLRRQGAAYQWIHIELRDYLTRQWDSGQRHPEKRHVEAAP